MLVVITHGSQQRSVISRLLVGLPYTFGGELAENFGEIFLVVGGKVIRKRTDTVGAESLG